MVVPLKVREYFRLLHFQTTSCILAFAIIGSVFAPVIYWDRLLWILLQLFLGGGIAANYFDEIQGRPWNTTIPKNHLWIIGLASFFGSILIGIYLLVTFSWWFGIFIAVWGFFTLSYDLELFDGRFHNTACLSISWGSICLGSYLLQSHTITPYILVVSLITGRIAGQGRDLYERAKPFSKDHDTSADAASQQSWTLLKTYIVVIDVISLVMLAWRLTWIQ